MSDGLIAKLEELDTFNIGLIDRLVQAAQIDTDEKEPFLEEITALEDSKYYHLKEEFERFIDEGISVRKAMTLAYTSFVLQNEVQVHAHEHGPGVAFYDVGDLLIRDGGIKDCKDALQYYLEAKGINYEYGIGKKKKIGGMSARGFWGADWLSDISGNGTFMIRKNDELPGPKKFSEAVIEYGKRKFCVQDRPELRNIETIIIDDLSATGGSLEGAIELVKKLNSKVTDIVLLSDINIGTIERLREKYSDINFHVLMQFSKKAFITYTDKAKVYEGSLVGAKNIMKSKKLEKATAELVKLEAYHLDNNQINIERVSKDTWDGYRFDRRVVYEMTEKGMFTAAYIKLDANQHYKISFKEKIDEKYLTRVMTAFGIENKNELGMAPSISVPKNHPLFGNKEVKKLRKRNVVSQPSRMYIS